MMRYLLDTNICIALLKNKYGVREAIIKAKPWNCCVSEITLAELYFGAEYSDQPRERLKDVDFIVSHFSVMPIIDALPIYGKTKATLWKQGTPIDEFDLLIGSTAIANDLVMVTENVKHLGKIPDIKIENWINRDL